MSRKLPPLNALRAFEAAARLLSFTKAAEELNVTQAAISHQVKQLEETLGVALFRRMNRRLILTEEGQGYLPALREAFDGIAAATQKLHSRDESGPLKITTLHSVAVKWLLPRLPNFQERHPDIDVMVSSGHHLVDLAREDFDLGFRYGRGQYPGLTSEILMGEEIVPVCNPALTRGPSPLRSPHDLGRFTLLHDLVGRTADDPDWGVWLEMAGVKGVDCDRGPRFSDTNMVIQAAIAGQGVAITRRALVQDDIDAGLLVQPFGPVFPTAYVYNVTYLPATGSRRKVRLFIDWLKEEMAKTEASLRSTPLTSSEPAAPAAAAEPSPAGAAS